MGDYHDRYLKSDVLLQTDVFENSRKTCLQYYKLDPFHYFTSAGLSWGAMLKMTRIRLELMTDVDMYQFIEKGLREGISYIANRYGQANNKYTIHFPRFCVCQHCDLRLFRFTCSQVRFYLIYMFTLF